jgi:hypothetical protein
MKFIKLISVIACLSLASTTCAQNVEPTWLVRRATSQTAPAFDTLAIGEATRDQVITLCGPPTAEKDRVQVWKDIEACRRNGLYSIAAQYDNQNILEELELILARPLEPRIVENDLRLEQPTARTDASSDPSVPAERLVYAQAGIRLLIARERVIAIQLFEPTETSTVDLLQRIRVSNLQCRVGSFNRGRTGIAVSATVQTDGCAKQRVIARARLRTLDGQPIRAAGLTRSYSLSTAEQVQLEWGNHFFVDLFIPYRSLNPVAGQRGQVILTLDAQCAGLYSCAETSIGLPPAQNPLVLPQIRITEQRVTLPSEEVQVVIETDRLNQQTMTAQLSLRETGTKQSKNAGSTQSQTEREFGDVQDFKIALDRDAVEVNKKPLILRSTVECTKLRAIAEMVCVFHPKPEGMDDPGKGSPCLIEIIQPAGEMLTDPYRDRLDSRPHTVPFEVQVKGLPKGLRSLRLTLENGGERYLWCLVTSETAVAVFEGDIPLPLGPYHVTLSLPDATETPSITLKGKLPEYPYAPTKEDLDEWTAYVTGWQQHGKAVAVAWGQSNLGRDYYLLGKLDQAQESLDKAITILSRNSYQAEQLRNACRTLAKTYLLRGNVAAMNTAYEQCITSKPTAEEFAYLTLDWAQSRALLESDPSEARRIREDAIRHAFEAGITTPPTPPWVNQTP